MRCRITPEAKGWMQGWRAFLPRGEDGLGLQTQLGLSPSLSGTIAAAEHPGAWLSFLGQNSHPPLLLPSRAPPRPQALASGREKVD